MRHLGATHHAIGNVVLVEDEGTAAVTRGRVTACSVEEARVAQQQRSGRADRDDFARDQNLGAGDRYLGTPGRAGAV